MEKLNSRQWKLHDLLNMSFEGFTTQEIMSKITEYGTYDSSCSDNSNSINIRLDIVKLFESDETDKIAIYKIKNGKYIFKLATPKEAEEFAEQYKQDAINKLVKYSRIFRKIKKHGQMKMISNKGDLIDVDSKARNFVESFAKYQLSQQEIRLEDLEVEELRMIYYNLCIKTHNMPIKLGTINMIREINAMKEELENGNR